MPYFVAFCGASGSGKTTLIEKLIPILTEMGHRVAALKHTAHTGHTLGDEGKDSDRLFKAGAITSIFWCPEQMMIKKRPQDLKLPLLPSPPPTPSPTGGEGLREGGNRGLRAEIPDALETYLQDADIVLVEGLQNSSWPEDKILVTQRANPQMYRFSLDIKDRVMAVVVPTSPPPQSSPESSPFQGEEPLLLNKGEWSHEEVRPSHERRRDGEAAGSEGEAGMRIDASDKNYIPKFSSEDVEAIAEFIVRKLYALC